MNKQAQYFAKVAEYKERFRQLPTAVLRARLAGGSLYKEAQVALREVIAEREAAGESERESSSAT
jgi:hypothetical protein